MIRFAIKDALYRHSLLRASIVFTMPTCIAVAAGIHLCATAIVPQVGLSTQALGNATIGDLLDDQDTADGPAPTEHAALKKVARARKSTDATIASLQAELHIQTLKAEREEKDSHADALSKRRVEVTSLRGKQRLAHSLER